MTAVPERVLSWLHNSLTAEYRDVNRTYSDVAKALSAYPSLSPRTDVYTYEDGSSALLLLLQGTLPVAFRGNTYRFPLALWFPHVYPREPPMIYVMPTPEMLVRPGQHVSTEGRVYHPYLVHWRSHWDKSSVVDFLSVLREVFAKEPPVMSKQQPQQQQPQQQQQRQQQQQQRRPSVELQATPPPPRPPPPPDRRGVSPQAESTLTQNPGLPPPKPPKQPQFDEPRAQLDAAEQRATSSHAPPLPPKAIPSELPGSSERPPNGHPVPPREGTDLVSQGASNQQYQKGPPLPPLPHEQIPYPQQRMNRIDTYPQHASQPPQPDPRYAPPVPHPPPQHYPPGQQQIHPQYQPQYATHSQQPLHQQQFPKPQPPVDLLSGPLDLPLPTAAADAAPAPPIPPNPEKDALLHAIAAALQTQLTHTLSQNAAALPALQAQHAAMQAAQASMQHELSQLQDLDALLADNEGILRDAMRDADRAVEGVAARQVPKVDDVLIAPTAVGEQLYGLVADERSIADAMFALTRALDRGRVGADVFVKQTRALARERFLKRALIKKIAKGMGLALEEEQGMY